MINNIFNKIIFNGCSFTEGGGFEAGKREVIREYKEKYGFEYKCEKDVSYPTIVQRLLPNVQVINQAKSGSGAERILRKAWEYINSHSIEECRKTLFIFEVPEAITRLDKYSNKYNTYLVANVAFDYDKGIINDTQVVMDWIYGPPLDETYRNKARQVIRDYSEMFINPMAYDTLIQYQFLGFASFCIQNGIQFYYSGCIQFLDDMCNKFYPDFSDKYRLNVELNGKIEYNFYGYSHHNNLLIKDEVPNVSQDGHPGYVAHQNWAEAIVEFLNKKYYKKYL